VGSAWVSFARTRYAWPRFALVRFASMSVASMRCASARFAVVRSAPLKRIPVKVVHTPRTSVARQPRIFSAMNLANSFGELRCRRHQRSWSARMGSVMKVMPLRVRDGQRRPARAHASL
jgi:hypothetical protein